MANAGVRIAAISSRATETFVVDETELNPKNAL